MSFRLKTNVNASYPKSPVAAPQFVNPFEDQSSRNRKLTLTKASCSQYENVKEVMDFVWCNTNLTKSSKSSERRVRHDEVLEPEMRPSLYDQAPSMRQPTSRLGRLYQQLSSKQQTVQYLKAENQCLRVLLKSQVSRVSQQNQDIKLENQSQIQYLTETINQLRGKGCRQTQRSSLNEFQLQLQDQIQQLNRQLQQAEDVKFQMQEIITSMYRQSLCPLPKRRLPTDHSRTCNLTKEKIRDCVDILDQLIK